jgi:fucose 4-O-acetylase-like acetyltransferase
LCRFLGAVGIVWFHCQAPGGWLALTALPMFEALVVFFSIQSYGQSGFFPFIKSRFISLIVPWVAWSFIFLALKIIQAFTQNSPITNEFAPYMLLTGTALHLWFLPFAFVSGAIIAPFVQLDLRDQINLRIVLSVCIIASIGSGLVLRHVYGLIPIAQWLSSAPAAMLGIMACAATALAANRTSVLLTLALICIGLVLIGLPSDGVRLLLAGFLLLLALSVTRPLMGWFGFLGKTSLGIYLIHPIFISILTRSDLVERHSAGFALVTIAGSALSVVIMQRLPWVKAIV